MGGENEREYIFIKMAKAFSISNMFTCLRYPLFRLKLFPVAFPQI